MPKSSPEGKLGVCGGTVVGPSREQSVVIHYSFSSLCRTLAVTGSNADLWDPKCHLFSIVQGAVIKCILLVFHVYSVLIKQLE